jgi:hypothetical protein
VLPWPSCGSDPIPRGLGVLPNGRPTPEQVVVDASVMIGGVGAHATQDVSSYRRFRVAAPTPAQLVYDVMGGKGGVCASRSMLESAAKISSLAVMTDILAANGFAVVPTNVLICR